MFMLSYEKETIEGMRLCGIDGVVVKTAEEFSFESEKANLDENIGIILVTNTLGEIFENEIVEFRKTKKTPVVIVPDINSSDKKSNSISSYVHDAVGIIV